MGRPNAQVSATTECVPNIGVRGRRRRALSGVVWLAVTAVVFVVLAQRSAPPLAFLLVAPFTGLAAVYLFQAWEKT